MIWRVWCRRQRDTDGDRGLEEPVGSPPASTPYAERTCPFLRGAGGKVNAHLSRFLALAQARLPLAMLLFFLETSFKVYSSLSTVWEASFLFLEGSKSGEKRREINRSEASKWTESTRRSRDSPRCLLGAVHWGACAEEHESFAVLPFCSEAEGRGRISDREWDKRVSVCAHKERKWSGKESSRWEWVRPLWGWGLAWGRRANRKV